MYETTQQMRARVIIKLEEEGKTKTEISRVLNITRQGLHHILKQDTYKRVKKELENTKNT